MIFSLWKTWLSKELENTSASWPKFDREVKEVGSVRYNSMQRKKERFIELFRQPKCQDL